jgi:hypothetical protein
VVWNGTGLTNLVDQGIFPGNGWANLKFIAPATNSTTVLLFAFQDDFSYLALDDVSVTAVPPPVFLSAYKSAGSLNFTWTTVAGVGYQVQWNSSLSSAGGWNNLGGVTYATGSTLSSSDTIGANQQRYYRVAISP